MGEIPRYVVVPTHNRPEWIVPLVRSMSCQCDVMLVLDNASDPPLTQADLDVVAGEYDGRVELIRDEQQPPNLARFWNLMLDRCEKLATEAGASVWDVAILNDDVLIPHGWLDIAAEGLREHPTAVVAHTGTGRRIHAPDLRTVMDNELDTRMCPHAFVTRGEAGLRADESMLWWYLDTDLDWQARLSGGVLTVPGPLVSNALAGSSTVGVLREQADKDRATFEAKWDVVARW